MSMFSEPIPFFPEPTIKAVLDRSALESYTRGHVHVGELVATIADNDDLIAVPSVALLEAHARSIGDKHAQALLELLVTLRGVTVVSLGSPEVAEVAESVEFTDDDLSRAHSVWAALKHEAVYFTTEPEQVDGVLTDYQVIAIPPHDA
jgi:hypothetical protein